MDKAKKRLYNKQYYERNKEHILFYMREYNLNYRNRHRKYYKKLIYENEIPVDLLMMRNKMKFSEGQRLDY